MPPIFICDTEEEESSERNESDADDDSTDDIDVRKKLGLKNIEAATAESPEIIAGLFFFRTARIRNFPEVRFFPITFTFDSTAFIVSLKVIPCSCDFFSFIKLFNRFLKVIVQFRPEIALHVKGNNAEDSLNYDDENKKIVISQHHTKIDLVCSNKTKD